MTTLKTVEGGNVDETERNDKYVPVMGIICVILVVLAIVGWIVTSNLASDLTSATSQTAFPSGGPKSNLIVWAGGSLFVGIFGMMFLAEELFDFSTEHTGSFAISIVVSIPILIMLLMPFLDSKPSLASWAEQRYGIQLDEATLPYSNQLHDGIKLNDTIIIHETEKGFLLYDINNQKELPLKAVTK